MSTDPLADSKLAPLLPADDAQRVSLHNEVHARPSARIRLPALIVYVAVLNEGVTREQECEQLRRLPGQEGLTPQDLANNFLRLRFTGYTVKWERHTEFTRYSIVQPLPANVNLGDLTPQLLIDPVVPPEWLRQIPGRTVAAIQLAVLEGNLNDGDSLLARARNWFDGRSVVASQMGNGHSWAVTQFYICADGYERMLVITPPDTTETRVGRVTQRLLELETYRLMALRGLPVAKQLGPMLSVAESSLSEITGQMERKATTDAELLDTLVALAARVERATSEHMYRFSATSVDQLPHGGERRGALLPDASGQPNCPVRKVAIVVGVQQLDEGWCVIARNKADAVGRFHDFDQADPQEHPQGILYQRAANSVLPDTLR